MAWPEEIPGAPWPSNLTAGRLLKRSSASGPEVKSHIGKRPERHHFPLFRTNVELSDRIGTHSEGWLGGHQHLPGASELVEVVDVVGTERCRQRVEQVVERHAQRLGFFPIHVHVQLRHAGTPQSLHASKLRILVGGREEFAHFLGQPLRPAFAAILDVELETAGIAQPEDRRRRKRQHQSLLDVGGLHEVIADQLPRADIGALVPVLLRHEDGRCAVAKAAADEIQAGKGHGVLVGGVGLHRLEHLADHPVGSLQGGAIRQEHRSDVITLIFVRHQAARGDSPQAGGDHHHPGEQHQADGATADDPGGAAGIAPGDTAEPVVEPAEEASRRIVLALEDQDAQARRQRERHDPGEHDCDGDGDRELAVELARQSAEEGDRHEHRAQRQHDGDHRAGDLAHGLDRRFARVLVLLVHDALDVFQHHDGVVHHDADRQHHAEQVSVLIE